VIVGLFKEGFVRQIVLVVLMRRVAGCMATRRYDFYDQK
jgi:hypothetical protein